MAPAGALFEAAVTAVGLCVDVVGVSEFAIEAEVAVEADDVLVDTAGVEAAAEDPPLGENAAATAGFELRKPDVRSPIGHPFCRHGLDLQHPMNAGVVKLQIYHWPAEHCWSGNWPL